ncbi:Na+/H+ antiporter subunit B [Agriterribacter sp.]|uniref:Na+/H+ antiporter subunit B n=1 Tax=Agriterribacter sp. TaxID=2821509 RepID=UPI002CAFEDD6|nr:Na+/H+ antiporter subunit B [Agriterribacter sp.]HRO48159.1 Na+/H+ antiporter subunit B [Agriterribacter sp.]HRQ19087.1 Na+/H+ antiporter subunit B [Agriterribacter sp.]
MNSIILKTASSYLLPLLLMFSVFILLRGHSLSGGGFVGGLVASIAFVLHAFAHGFDKARAIFRTNPGFLIPVGLFLCFIMGAVPTFFGAPFMKGLWLEKSIPGIGHIGTALFFDIGVFIVVIGVTLTILFTISESDMEQEEV